MKVLFINSQPINRDWSTGNTFLNFFENFPKEYSFHEICLRNGKFEPGFLKSAVVIEETAVIKSFFNRKPVNSIKCDLYSESDQLLNIDQKASKAYRYKDTSIVRYMGVFMRNFFWKHGMWKESVDAYLKELRPDIIFFATSGMAYLHNLMHYAYEVSGAPVVLFHADDHFTFKCISANPLFWINRISTRNCIKKAVNISSHNFCITQLQCDEYSEAMHKPCELLTKGLPFSGEFHKKELSDSCEVEFVYTGNIFYDRWRTLVYIGKLLDKLYELGYVGVLKIYSGNELSSKIKKKFDSVKSIRFMGSAPNTEIQKFQKNADVLVHVESFSPLKKLKVRQSFSTKIVDYIHSERCVLAAGATDIAPIQYFSQNDIGIVLDGKEKNDLETLRKVFDYDVRCLYAKNAWDYGCLHHDSKKIQQKLIEVFSKVVNVNKEEMAE